jgi:hypothetical protein
MNENQAEILREGLDALVQKLGKVGAVRFLQLFNKNNGDSVEDKHERDVMLKNMGVSFDDVLADIKKWEAENK